MGRRNTSFNRENSFFDTARINRMSYIDYFDQLTEMALTMFEWKNVPDTIDVRFLELCLFYDGKALWFKDDVTNEFYGMRTMIGGQFNNYNIPKQRTAYAPNGYNNKLDDKNSVIVFNNLLHNNTAPVIMEYARKLYEIDRTIDVNVKAHKHPVIITCDEKQKFSMKELYRKYDGNEPVIFGYKNLDAKNSISSLNTGAPYICDRLYELKSRIWNEALTYIGIPNIVEEKKERLITDEVNRLQGGTMACQYSKLKSRRLACEEINRMFGLNISCDFRYGIGDEEQETEEDINE